MIIEYSNDSFNFVRDSRTDSLNEVSWRVPGFGCESTLVMGEPFGGSQGQGIPVMKSIDCIARRTICVAHLARATTVFRRCLPYWLRIFSVITYYTDNLDRQQHRSSLRNLSIVTSSDNFLNENFVGLPSCFEPGFSNFSNYTYAKAWSREWMSPLSKFTSSVVLFMKQALRLSIVRLKPRSHHMILGDFQSQS